MNASSVALQGMRQAEARVESAAAKLSRSALGGAESGAGGDVVDLSAEVLALLEARNMHSAMVSVAQSADGLDAQILNLLG